MEITKLLAFAVEQGASDCHLSSAEPLRVRFNGILKKLEYSYTGSGAGSLNAL